MKELSIEEKAKRYDEALERAVDFKDGKVHYSLEPGESIVNWIFPELRESEDERIRKDIIWCFKHSGIEESRPINPHVTTTIKDAIAWLEKQGEQKSIDELTQQEAMDIAVAKCFEQGGQKPVENRQETKPNGGIVYEDFNEGDGYYKVNLAYLSKSQVELIENLVDSWQNHANNSVEWGEEDETMKNQLVDFMLSGIDISKAPHGCVAWIKSLRPQKQWKPSDEQIRALEYIINNAHNTSYSCKIAKELLEELKKLKGE